MRSITISILGCGWLGLPLAKRLIQSGYTVKGSTKTSEKLSLLRQEGIVAYFIECQSHSVGPKTFDFFNSEVLILTVPFRQDLNDPEIYRFQIESIIKEVEGSPIDFVIFTSSTSVYPRTLSFVQENTSFNPDNPRSKVLLEVENDLMTNSHFSTTVVRLGGLYGPNRPIGQFWAEKTDFQGASQPVNLIHLDDCISIILQIIQQDIRGEIFNAVSDHHPTRQELYKRIAQKRGLKLPTFGEESTSYPRIISNLKVKEKLKIKFIHPDPLLSVNGQKESS